MSATERMGMGCRRHPQLVLLAVLLAAAGASVFLGRFPAPGWTSPLRLLDEATRILQDAGFDVRIERILGGFFGTVRFQEPGAGGQAPKGTEILLKTV